MTQSPPESFRPNRESFDNLYRGESAFPGGPPPGAIPWDVGQAQPRLMELEALGAISGEVLDIGCGLGDNAIFLASRGHSVTGLDGSPAAIDRARARAADAGLQVRFDVADATELTGYDGGVRHGDRQRVAALPRRRRPAGVRRGAAPRDPPGARWFISCFSDGNVNGVIAPMGAVPEDVIRDTLAGAGWRIDFLGPTTYLGDAAGFTGDPDVLPSEVLAAMPPERLEALRQMGERMSTILPLIDGDRVFLPFTVVHATRIG